MPNKHQYVH